MTIKCTINGRDTDLEATNGANLATALRQAGYRGVKCGCDGGTCGASKVLIDGTAQMACGLDASEADGAEIVTVEGLGRQHDLHPIQQAFVDHFAVQCGFCTPGMIIQAAELLTDNPDPSEQDIREALDDNYCRCTGYQKPVEAIKDAATRLNGGEVVTIEPSQTPTGPQRAGDVDV